MDPLSIGRDCYGRKDYDGALLAFTELVNLSTDFILLTALDHRAATYEKLDKLQSALKDAKDMIDLKPTSAKGYLRCGKVLQLKGKQETALLIYERGLKRVKVGHDPERTKLQEMYSKLSIKRKPKENFDPLVKLPTELARMVLMHMGVKERVLCLSVSKPWKRLLEGSHDLWTVLDLRNAKRPASMDAVKAYVRRSNYTLRDAFVNTKSVTSPEKFLKFVTKTCKNLNRLDYSGGGYLGESLIAVLPDMSNLRILTVRDAEMDLSTVLKALRLCFRLEVVSLGNIKTNYRTDCEWPQLNSLVSLSIGVSESVAITKLNLEGLISCSPNLRSASIVYHELSVIRPANGFMDFSQWSKLEELELINGRLEQAPAFPPTLKHLRIYDNSCWEYTSDEEVAAKAKMPLLETLAFPGHTMGSGVISILIAPSVKAGNLKHLDLGGRLSFGNLFPEETSSIPSLEFLSLEGCPSTEDELLNVLRRCPSLRRLNIAHTNATGVTVKEVSTRAVGPLEWLNMNMCWRVSADAVAWARELKTMVLHNMELKTPARRPSFFGTLGGHLRVVI